MSQLTKLPNGMLARIHASARLSDGEITWDVAQLCSAVEAWQQQLDAWQVNVVAFDLPNGLEWVALDLALLESGRVAVPLPSFFSPEQRQHALQDSGAQLLVVASDVSVSEPEHHWQMFRGQACRQVLQAAIRRLPPSTSIITYTSGSTGTPKGVCLAGETLMETAESIVSALQDVEVTRHLSVLPLTLLLENVAGIFANLMNGSDIYVPDLSEIGIRGSSDVDIMEFVAGLDRFSPHSVILVPALLLGLTAASEFGLGQFAGLKFIAVGGGRVAQTLLARAEAQGLSVFEGYGLTECGSVVALNTPGASRQGSVGRLLPHVVASLEDGELIVTHPKFLGVLGSQDAAPARVATGDAVAMDEAGFLTVHGRLKDTYITAFGRNVSPEWVESELLNELSIGYAAVFGEASESATALLVARGEASDEDLEKAVAACNARLPDYARIGRWHRITREQLHAVDGLTANGRIRRAVIAEGFAHLIEETNDIGISLHA